MSWYKKSQDELGSEGPKYNPSFDIKKVVKNEDDAAVFITELILDAPEDLPKFLGFSSEDVLRRIRSGFEKAIKEVATGEGEQARKSLPKDYMHAIELTQKILFTLRPYRSVLKNFIFPLLGFAPGKQEVIERLYEYAPMVIRGEDFSKNLEREIMEDSPSEKVKSIDDILDRYNAGKINKEQMEWSMKEFASFRSSLFKEGKK